MADREQLLNDQEEAMRLMMEGNQINLWTTLPAIVTAVDLEAMTLEVQPTIQAVVQDQFGGLKPVNLPVLVNVPILFPGGGGFIQTSPIAIGDEVLVFFASRCIDAWWQSGGVQQAMEARMHDLSDGFALCGPKSQPNVVSDISSTKWSARSIDGTVFLTIGSKFSMTNATTSLLSILTNLESTLNTFMSTLAAFAGGAAPTSQAMLQAPAAAAVAQLALILVEIGALLE